MRNLPSLLDNLVWPISKIQLFDLASPLDPTTVIRLSKECHVGYVLTAQKGSLVALAQPQATPSQVELIPADEIRLNEVTEFICKNYYLKFPSYTESDIKAFRTSTAQYEQFPRKGLIARRGHHIAGVLLVLEFDFYETVGSPSAHIGYWGYDRDQLAPHEARWLKNLWFQYLNSEVVSKDTIDCIVRPHNTPSLKLALSRGFTLKRLRLDPKPF